MAHRLGKVAIRVMLGPNLVGLDAPVVAVVWMKVFGRLADVEVSDRATWLLFLAVWLIYSMDRWLDASRRAFYETERHQIHEGFPRSIQLAYGLVLLLLFKDAVIGLNARAWIAGVMLVFMTAGYFFCVHWQGERFPRSLPKELWVGMVFAAGCALVPWSLGKGLECWIWIVPLLGWVCFLNCAAITRWENLRMDRERPGSLLNTWPVFLARLAWICGITSAVCIALLLFLPAQRLALVSLAVSGVLLGMMDVFRESMDRRLLRVLADVALLTPLLFVFFG